LYNNKRPRRLVIKKTTLNYYYYYYYYDVYYTTTSQRRRWCTTIYFWVLNRLEVHDKQPVIRSSSRKIIIISSPRTLQHRTIKSSRDSCTAAYDINICVLCVYGGCRFSSNVFSIMSTSMGVKYMYNSCGTGVRSYIYFIGCFEKIGNFNTRAPGWKNK